MKKTLLAVAIPALLASGAASATTLYDNNGTKIDIRGSLRLVLEYDSNRDRNGEDGTKFRDIGSRFGFKVVHNIGDGLYGLGELEFGHNTQQQEKSFQLRNRLAYVGFGLEDVGELTYGRVLSPWDDIDLTDYTYDYGGILDFGYGVDKENSDNFVGRVSNTVKFMTADFSGFSIGGTYTIQADDSWGDDKEATQNVRGMETRNAYTLVAFYDTGFGLKANAGYGHAKANGGAIYDLSGAAPVLDRNVNKFEVDIWGVSAEYTIDALSIAGSFGRATAKNEYTLAGATTRTTKKPKSWLYGVGAKYNIDQANIYGGFYYADANDQSEIKDKKNFVVGTDYHFTPSVRTYIEYSHDRIKDRADKKEIDNRAMIGMRVYF